VRVDQPFASGPVEQRRCRALRLGAGTRLLGLLERSPQGGTLRTVAHGRRARLTHVLLGGCDIRHEIISRMARKCPELVGDSRYARRLELRFRECESQAAITL